MQSKNNCHFHHQENKRVTMSVLALVLTYHVDFGDVVNASHLNSQSHINRRPL